MYTIFASLALAVAMAGCIGSGRDAASGLPDVVDFNRHIRPILAANCYVCHGPDISTREAGLRLDLRDSALVVLESGNTAVVPEHPEESELILRVTSSDPEERMPPAEQKKILDEREVALLRRWIEQGAEWKPHWAFIPPQKPDLPRVRRSWKVDNEIDRFIEAELEANDLKPAPEASKNALIRRLSFVLTGLPPTPEGVRAFLEDESEHAYEKLVDRLLASPHFGERWARHWMDVVRYADTRGHEFDYPVIGAWRYRDYLIRAFNTDIPYDQFIREHLAGDMLAQPRLNPETGFNESILATTFFALGEGKHSPVDLQIDEAERIDNIIDVTGKAFQGLTISCAKCHDHKFDPIPTTDYYALYGIVKSTRFAVRASNVTPEVRQTVAELASLKNEVRRLLARQWREDIERQAVSVIATAAFDLPGPPQPDTLVYTVLGDFRRGSFDGWFEDGLAFGDTPINGMSRIDEEGSLQELATPRISSARYSSRLMGALRSPTFVLDTDHITVRAAGRHATVRVILENFQLIQNPIYGPLEIRVDDPTMRDYQFDLGMWKGHKAYVEFVPGYYQGQDFIKEDSAYIEAVWAVANQEPVDPSQTPHSAETSNEASESGALRRAVLAWEDERAAPWQIDLLNDAIDARLLSRTAPSLKDLTEEMRTLESRLPESEVFIGVVDGTGEDHPVFIRGNVQNPTEAPVPRRGLTIHDPTQTPFHPEGSGRLELARIIADPDNALTARVMVNRLWHHVFGRGLVETVDNFGVQGKWPSHPALLDYLAVRFIEEGWSMKAMIREMVMSQAFRRSSQASAEAERRDPENLLLQHYAARRLEAEAIRDAILAASGRLNPQMYGESEPIYLSEFMTGRGRPAKSGPLDGDGRRTLYLSVRRNFLSPMLLVFDMPIPFTTFGRRNTSNVPAQSLTLLNDPFVRQQAEYWSLRLMALKELDAGQKIEQIYWTAFARPPEPDEVEEALRFLEQQTKTYGLDAKALATDHRPWQDLCHTIFNIKEFIHML